ncbi:MAG: DUF1579 domain-containing protein [Parvularculaceae bacterium]
MPDRDFDFFFGRWRVAHRRLVDRLQGCDRWESFDGACVVQPLLGGRANIDDNLINLPAGFYRAATLRTYDPQTDQWSIWWLDGRRPRALDTPVVGRFTDGAGAFYADDSLNGRPIRVRFQWTRINSAAPRWDQAISADGGRSWETNWTMDFDRAAD